MPRLRPLDLIRRAALVTSALLGLACSRPDPPAEEPAAPEAAISIELPDEMAGLDPASWVKIYDPVAAFNGFTLVLYDRRLPMLIDMNGNVAHAWPKARVKTRIRLLEDGSLLAIGKGRRAVEYDWDGHQIWTYRLPKGLPHHDVIRLTSGNNLLVIRPHGSRYDGLLEIDREGQVAWEWRAEDHLEVDPAEIPNPGDVTHINSVQELPPNPWFEGGDSRFRPGNLLVSARNLSRVFVVERETGDVVWAFDDQLDMQHEALMVGPGDPRQGNILILSNGKRSTYGYRKSTVLEVQPGNAEILWEYRDDAFYTRFGGLQQPLPNGNVLIVSADRTFEVDREGRIVWQWAPPFRPTRSRRYAADHCPQLAALARGRRPVAVRPPSDYRHVDRPVYQFAYPEDRNHLKLGNETIQVLEDNNACRRLLLPAKPSLEVGFGLRPEVAAASDDHGAIRFAVRLEPDDASGASSLFEETLTSTDLERRTRSLDLAEHGNRWVRLCVETAASQNPDTATEPLAYWLNPAISSGDRQNGEDPTAEQGLTPEELAVRTEHLEALGYVD